MTAHHAHRPTLKWSHHVLPAEERASRPVRWLEAVPWTGLSLVLAVGGLLAVVAMPRSEEVERRLAVERTERELHHHLRQLRSAVQAYHSQHDAWPGLDPEPRPGSELPAPSANWFARQLLMRTDGVGHTSLAAVPSHPYGPYLRGGLPVNPANGLGTVRVLGEGQRMPAAPDGTTGWIYDPGTGALRANCEGELRRGGARYYDL